MHSATYGEAETQRKYLTSAVKCSGEKVMICSCFAATGPGSFHLLSQACYMGP